MNYLTRVFSILAIFVFSVVTGYTTPKAENFILNSSEKSTLTQSSSFTDTLTYIRVNIDGKWWIYVFDGLRIVDCFSE